MSLIAAMLFPKPVTLPPEISSEREGAIRRNFCAKNPRERRAKTCDPQHIRQYAEQQANRALIYDSVLAGHDTAPKLMDHTGKNSRTVWAHIHALADEGMIKIDRTVKPWRFIREE